MRFDNFIGGYWSPSSRIADSQRVINLYTELVNSGAEVNPRGYLRGTPGRSAPYCTIDAPVRCLWSGFGGPSSTDRMFAVGGGSYYELIPVYNPAGEITALNANKRGSVSISLAPAQIIPNGNQLLVVSNNQAYLDNGGSPPFGPVTPASTATFIDGYFVASQPGTAQFNISDLSTGLGGFSWDPLDFGVKQGYPDAISAVFAAYDLLWLFGFQTTEVWYNSGNNNFPFQRIQGAFFQVGCVAPFSVGQVGNTIMWLGSVYGGKAQVMQAQGYSFPVTVSNRALDTAIQSYPVVSDAVGYPYEEDGHIFYVLTFPSAGVTWCYDLTTQQWHQRGTWVPAQGKYLSDTYGGQTHTYCFGKHWVGDSVSGNVYAQSNTTYTDNGNVIRRLRSAPHMTDENKRSRYDRLELFLQKGTVPAGSDPQFTLRTSDDGGFTWSHERTIGVGGIGEYGHRVIWRRLGSGRDRVYEVSTSMDGPVAIVDAFLNIQPGTN